MADTFHQYVQNWMPTDSKLLPFYIGIDNFLDTHLTNTKNIDLEAVSPKIIADPLLGYIHLTSLEVAIVDSMLFQRLRKIRQLGLAYLVFPTLGYTRFEHSLGVLGRLNQILNKIIENNERRNQNDIIKQVIDEYTVPIRLAALLHDLGHCLFSHCSERVIEQVKGSDTYPSAQYIQNALRSAFPGDKILEDKKKTIPFAEVFTIAILGSRKFHDFLESFNYSNKKEIEKTLKITARFILGLPVEGRPDTIFLSQLISSGLDCDKIDYMIREQHYSGIKLEIDLDRILSKLCVFDLKFYDLPNQLCFLKKHFNSAANFKILGFEKGGQFAFEEFCVARLALHVKIYLHQKVRAAEAQLSAYLCNLLDSPVLKEVHSWLLLTEKIIEYPEIITQRFSSDGTLFNSFNLSERASSNLKKIDNRDLVHRAFAFGPINSYSEGLKGEDISEPEKLKNYFADYQDIDIKREIEIEAINLCDEYGIELDENLLDSIIIDIPRLLNIQQGQESLHFERSTYLPVRWTIPIDRIIIYYQENRALAYIFSEKEICHIVAIATEKVLFEKTAKVYSQESHLSPNVYKKFQKQKLDLTDRSYYEKFPQLKPISEYLKTAEASEMVSKIHDNLKAFKSLNDEHITIERITTFVNQFPESVQDACLTFLTYLKVYNESFLCNELDSLLSKVTSENLKISLCPLGSATDSANRMYYHLKEITKKYQIEKQTINDTIVLDNEKIIFFDDNINSGLQVINIFAELLEEKESLPAELRLAETHNLKLVSPRAKEKFKSIPIYLVYIVGYEGIEEKIRTILSTHLGFKKENIFIKISHTLSNSKKIFSGADSEFGHAKKLDLKTTLSQIGEKLLTNEGKTETKIQSCKLGYANAEAMILFPYNIPTMTITALWCRGEVDGIPWIPLAERSRRSNRDGRFIGED